jgi:hypothetical protein
MNPPSTLTVILKNEGSLFPTKYYINLQKKVVNTDDLEEKIAAEQALAQMEEVVEEPQQKEVQ